MKKTSRVSVILLMLNCGIHDNTVNKETAEKNTTPEKYEENLRSIIKLAKSGAADVIWVTTTPLSEKQGTFNEGLEEYNAIAARIMAENNIFIIDLHNITKAYAETVDELTRDQLHFKDEVCARQGADIAKIILDKYYK